MSALHVESAGDGPPLVLLHGWAMHGGLWAPLRSPLASGRRVHAVDLPGHGYSEPVEPFTLEKIAETIATHFESEIEAPIVLGWSFGAMIAIAWALAQPKGVARLVLVGATPRFVAGPDWPHAMGAETLRRFHDELRVAYRLTLDRFLALQVRGSEHGRASLHALRGELFARGEPSAAVLEAGLDVLATTDLRARVRSIDAPCLVIAGGRDALTPPQAGAWLANAMPHARLATIDGAAHAPFLSHPHEFMRAIDAFLDDR